MSLSAENLSCLRADHLVFEDISFDLSPGQSLWVRGRNGAGKSSLLRVCARLLKAADGRLMWSGKDIDLEPDIYQQQYHYLGHQDALKAVFTVAENLNFWARFHGQADVNAALSSYELDGLRDTPVRILSAGQKKRVNLARLKASMAPLWILDEPLSALDTHFVELFKDQLQRHITAGGMAIFATHQDLDLQNGSVLTLDVADRP